MEEENEQKENLEEHEANDLVAKANQAAERMELANREHARLLQKEESLRVEKTLSGKSDVTEPKSVVESPMDYAKRVMKNDI